MTRRTHNANGEVPAEVSQWMRKAAHQSWANTPDRSARTAKARATFQQRFLDENDGDPVRAESARKAFYAGLAAKSAQTRRLNREARQAGAA